MIEQAIAVATSIGTLLMMWLAGRKKSLAWIVGLANQALWILFIVLFQAWGLLILTAALTVIYTRNLMLWRKEESWASRVLSASNANESMSDFDLQTLIHPSQYDAQYLILEKEDGEIEMVPRRSRMKVHVYRNWEEDQWQP